ncbi:MAG: NAD(P)/FAD-dependent oxidoreductase [Gemmatimonadota bacterium]
MAHTDVLIAGAGPAGSALAIRMARAGYRTMVVDRASFPRDKVCAEYMSPAAVRELDELGVVAALEADGGQPLAGTTVIGPKGARMTGLFAGADGSRSARSHGMSIARRLLDDHLVRAARAAGATVHERTTVEELVYDAAAVAGAVVRGPDGARRVIHARLTVGADGLRSMVARRIGRRRRAALPDRIALVAHVAGVPGLADRAEMHVGPGGYVGLNAIGAGVANVALVVPRRRIGSGLRGAGKAALFFKGLEAFPGVRGRIDPGRVVREVLVTGPFAAWSARVTAHGALLVGDAADFFDPFTGDGIYCALVGARLAAEAAMETLSRAGIVTDDRLAGYRAARRRTFLGKWIVERLIGYAMFAPWLFDRCVERLDRRGLAHTLIGVTADLLPARAVLNPVFLAKMVA